MATANDEEILEGFLCPICKADLKTASQLTNHFESLHQEEQDVLRSLKEIFGKAKKIILNNDDADIQETFDRALKFSYQDYYESNEVQSVGVSRSSTEYFKGVRSARLERYATETNKLLIRLDKLVCNMPNEPNQRRQHEQEVVPWLDGSSVKLCPNCAKAFNLTRRKHHCRLCGSILCHDCSTFLDINVARSIIDPSAPAPAGSPEAGPGGLRLCEHCHSLIQLRKQVQDSRNAKTPLVAAYDHMRSLMDEARPAVAMYEKMCQSLFDGETTYSLADVNALRGRVAKLAERVELAAQHVAAAQHAAQGTQHAAQGTQHAAQGTQHAAQGTQHAAQGTQHAAQGTQHAAQQPGARHAQLTAAIRHAASHFIKEELLSLRKLPSEAQISEVRRQRYERAERQIQRERERAERDAARAGAPPAAAAASRAPREDDDHPLLEQMNIIRGYIKEARKDLKFEEVAMLEANLKELKKEYQLQMLSDQPSHSA